MSNEASEVLKFEKEWLKYCNSYNDYVQESFKHIEEAITALSQTPCTDAISRTRLKEVFHRNVVCGEAYDELIDAQPSVSVAEKTGRWIPRNAFLLQYKCSECGRESEKYNYCPNCGAKMVEPKESEDKE